MKNFASLMHELGELAGEAIPTDLNNAVNLCINQKLHVQIEAESTGERILLLCKVVELPPGRFRENILKDALKANWACEIHPSVLAYVAKNNQLILFQYIHAHALSADALYKHLAIFVARAESWKDAINSGKTSPALTGEFPEGKNKPNMFGFK